jgi:hypothetical protein
LDPSRFQPMPAPAGKMPASRMTEIRNAIRLTLDL